MGYKHVPQRSCVACRKMHNKRELVRIVRTITGEAVIDPTGKLAGRGAYLCRNRNCWEQALANKGRVLNSALKSSLTDVEFATLDAFAQSSVDILPGISQEAEK
jgi:uncharacterized protein